ncbi:MAG TPA: amino acid adenylation domain-containing protein, partial [Polyangia bacterium]|nr:amino acid adenylation domain-containing protein [Polyangia bacterium]
GAAYVPLDPSYPADRLSYMARDAGLALTLGQDDVRACADRPTHAPAVTVAGEQAAYMIYTSGSTGKPKGAVNTHAGIANRLAWMQSRYRLDGSDAVLQKTPFSFDVSVWELFWPLLVGARLVMARPEGHKHADYLRQLIVDERVTTVHFVPSMLEAFLVDRDVGRCAATLRRIICSGEALGWDLVQRCARSMPGVAVQNLYGPTEAAVDVTAWACDPDDAQKLVPIGRPIDNTQIYVLDEQLEPVPLGVAGELHIGGVQVGRGYHARPALTAERFIPDPFSVVPGRRLYKTGDLARHLPDGAIEYLGRLDFQVKLRGFRIELGEIEAALVEQPAVRAATVVLREDTPGDARLVAYIVPRDPTADEQARVAELRQALAERLPAHMLPAAFVTLAELPLSPSGKLDRRALPAPAAPVASAEWTPPSSVIELELAALMQEVLKIERIGLHDNFFDMGGHSLLLVRFHSLLQTRFERAIAIVDLFKYPTVSALATYFSDATAAPAPRYDDLRERGQKQRALRRAKS